MASEQHSLLHVKKLQSLSGTALIELMKAVHEKGLPFRFRAGGFSMAPFIRDGDIITVTPCEEKTVQRGDIVAFVHPEAGKLVIHRVLKKRRDCFIVKGDNSAAEDGSVPVRNIMGSVTGIEREGSRIFLGLGLEKRLIAFLSERSLILRFRLMAAPLLKIFRPLQRRVQS